jgi:hypothetical protein
MADFLHEFLHRPTRMIAGDIVMEITPQAFDAVLIRAIGGQEMEFDSPL